jgi:hypothetical protein
MTSALLFWLHLDKEGLASTTLFPVFFWVRDDWWLFLPAFAGHWRHDNFLQGTLHTTWLTPLFHVTARESGEIDNIHVGPYFQGKDYWAVPPLLSWHVKYPDKVESTWLTPLFHLTTDPEGAAESAHLLPAFFWKRDDYWFAPLLLSAGWTSANGDRSVWGTPLFHWTSDSDGMLLDMHLGPYFQGSDYWAVPPLLSWHMKYPDHIESTWLTPLFHRTTDPLGERDSLHIGPYFQGTNYWAVPPLLSWHVKYPDNVGSTWLTPLFHLTTDPEGAAESAHLFPAFLWKRDDYWFAPPLLSAGWTSENGDRSVWGTPLFHWSSNSDGMLLDMHLGPYFQGEDYWGIPPLLTGGWRYSSGFRTTWVTPLFHVTSDPDGDVDSLHVGPYFQGKDYWAVPPLLSWHVKYPDKVESTWITPLFHLTTDSEGDAKSAHLFPAFFWEREDYWIAPPLLTGSWRERDGASTTWVTPLFHATTKPDGDLRSLHVAPLWFWERDKFWLLPPLLTGGGTHADGAQTTWITPLFHMTEDKAGTIESIHTFPLAFWKRDKYWLAPPLLSGGFTRPDGSNRTWITPLYHDDYAADGALRSRHILNYFEGADYHHVVPVFWDWKAADNIRYTLLAPPLFVRTEEANGDTTASLPWPLVTWRSGRALDTSLGMELRPFLYQEAGAQHEFNFLWRMVSVLSEESSTRVMVGPFWHSEKPKKDDSMTKFQILGGLFARDCNYETERYRYRILWFIPFGNAPMKADPLSMLDLHPIWRSDPSANGE